MKAFQPPDNPYEQLYGKKLPPEKVAEMRFNLVNAVETLIQMDRQHKAWVAEQAKLKAASKTSSNKKNKDLIN